MKEYKLSTQACCVKMAELLTAETVTVLLINHRSYYYWGHPSLSNVVPVMVRFCPNCGADMRGYSVTVDLNYTEFKKEEEDEG